MIAAYPENRSRLGRPIFFESGHTIASLCWLIFCDIQDCFHSWKVNTARVVFFVSELCCRMPGETHWFGRRRWIALYTFRAAVSGLPEKAQVHPASFNIDASPSNKNTSPKLPFPNMLAFYGGVSCFLLGACWKVVRGNPFRGKYRWWNFGWLLKIIWFTYNLN